MKENFTTKLIKRFYSISGPLDEYRRQEVDRLGNTVLVYLFNILHTINLIAVLASVRYPKLVGQIYPLFVSILWGGTVIYIAHRVEKMKLRSYNQCELDEKERRQFHRSGWKFGLYFGLTMLISYSISHWFIFDRPLIDSLTSPRVIIISIILGMMMGIIVPIAQKKDCEVQEDDEDN